MVKICKGEPAQNALSIYPAPVFQAAALYLLKERQADQVLQACPSPRGALQVRVGLGQAFWRWWDCSPGPPGSPSQQVVRCEESLLLLKSRGFCHN